MGKFAASSLVVLVFLAGTAVPGAALQGGPPDHAGNSADGGPPDHANAGGGDRSDGGTDDDREASDDDAEAGETDARDDGTAGADDRSTASGEEDATHSNLIGSLLERLDPSAQTPEESPATTATAPPVAGSSQDEREQFPFPEETDTPSPDAEPTSTETSEPTPTPDGEPASTGTPVSTEASGSTPTPDDDGSSAAGAGRYDPGPTVDIETGDDETTASVSGVDDGESVTIELRGPATDGEAVGVETVEVGLGDAEPFDLVVTRPTADGPEEPAPGASLAYFDVETDLVDVERATLTVDVEPAALPSDVAPEDVEVLRYHDGEWSSTETTTDGDATTVTAETRGFSTFAVAVPERQPLEVTDTAVPADLVRAGHEPTVRATVENPGDRRVTQSLAVTVDDETVETREVTLEGGETTTLAFELPAQAAGEHSVAVGGVGSGQLQVRGEATDTPAASEKSGLDFGFGIAAATFVLLSAVGTGLLAARRDEFDL